MSTIICVDCLCMENEGKWYYGFHTHTVNSIGTGWYNPPTIHNYAMFTDIDATDVTRIIVEKLLLFIQKLKLPAGSELFVFPHDEDIINQTVPDECRDCWDELQFFCFLKEYRVVYLRQEFLHDVIKNRVIGSSS